MGTINTETSYNRHIEFRNNSLLLIINERFEAKSESLTYLSDLSSVFL